MKKFLTIVGSLLLIWYIMIPILMFLYIAFSIVFIAFDHKRDYNADKKADKQVEIYVEKYVFEKYKETSKFINSEFKYEGGSMFSSDELYLYSKFQYKGYTVTCYKDSKTDSDTNPDCIDDKPSDEIVTLARAYALQRYGVSYETYDSHEIHKIYGVSVREAIVFKFNDNVVTCYTDTKICDDIIPSKYDEATFKLAVNYLVDAEKRNGFIVNSVKLDYLVHKKIMNPDGSFRICTTFAFTADVTNGAGYHNNLKVTCYYDTKICDYSNPTIYLQI